MSSDEFLHWMVFDCESPIGDERADAMLALVASTIANVNRDGRKKPEPYTVREFMLFNQPTEEEKQAELARKARAALLNTGR